MTVIYNISSKTVQVCTQLGSSP